MAEPARTRRDDAHHFAVGVAACGNHLAADMLGDLADVLHHGRYVLEDVAVLALEDVIRGAAYRVDTVGVVDEALADGCDVEDFTFQCELRRN